MGSGDVLVGGMMKAAASIDEIICILKLNEHWKKISFKNKTNCSSYCKF